MPLPNNSRVLDIGCGDCRRLRYRSYYRNDFVNYGIDIHEDTRCSNYLSKFYNLDVTREKLPFEEEYFDLVVVSHVIEHLPEDGFLFSLKEIKRVLKQGGYLYIEFPSEKTRHFITAKTLKQFGCPVTTFNFYDDETHISLYDVQELVRILKKEGLNVCRHGDVLEPVKKCLSPFLLFIGYVLKNESIFTGSLWSLVNWASFVIVRK
jgi:SAM-dependent methyltransferase